MHGGSRLPTITNQKAHGYAVSISAFSCDSIETVEISVHLEKQKRFCIYMLFNQLSFLLLLQFGLAFTVLLERDVTKGKDKENINEEVHIIGRPRSLSRKELIRINRSMKKDYKNILQGFITYLELRDK